MEFQVDSQFGTPAAVSRLTGVPHLRPGPCRRERIVWKRGVGTGARGGGGVTGAKHVDASDAIRLAVL